MNNKTELCRSARRGTVRDRRVQQAEIPPARKRDGLRFGGLTRLARCVGRVRRSRHPAHKRLRVHSLPPGGAALARAYGWQAHLHP